MEKIKVDEIKSDFQNAYHPELLKFSLENNIKLPRIKSGNGLALSVMSHNKNKYWTREDTEEFVKKYKTTIAVINKSLCIKPPIKALIMILSLIFSR